MTALSLVPSIENCDLEDLSYSLEVYLFEKDYERFTNLIVEYKEKNQATNSTQVFKFSIV